MAQIYKGAWTGSEGQLLGDDGEFESNALFWLSKIDHLENDQIAEALKRCESKVKDEAESGKDSFPPSYAQFLGYAESASKDRKGIKSARQAYQEAVDNYSRSGSPSWSHMVVYTAAKATGSYRLKTEVEAKSWPVFRENYNDALAKFRAGERLDALPKLESKPEPPKLETTKKQRNKSARPHLDQLKELLK